MTAIKTWLNLKIFVEGTEYGERSVFVDLINSYDAPKEAFELLPANPKNLYDWATINHVDWDTIEQDMKEFSLKYPNVEFQFTCDDQDGNYWREFYKNGLTAYVEAEIVYKDIEDWMYS